MPFPPTLSDRTRAAADPVRNFKFQTQITHPNPAIDAGLLSIGFTSIDGLSMTTDVSAYREGGWNTNPHKLPGQTDFSPISCSTGVFWQKPGMWDLAKQMFSVQWGQGTLGQTGAVDGTGEFRFDMRIWVTDHPVTKATENGSNNYHGSAVLGFRVYNAWVASVAFGGLNAGDNGILINSMTIHHEGLEVVYGSEAVNL
jgi:phage tail-like protein